MVIFYKQITLLIHIIIHMNGTIKTNYFSHHTLEYKKIPALYGAGKKNFCLWKHVKKIFQPDQTPPPPWKSNGRSLSQKIDMI